MTQPKDFKQFIAQKAFNKWAKENQTFIDDVQNLIHEMIMFEIKYGIKILYEFDKTQPPQGRGLGKELDAQALQDNK